MPQQELTIAGVGGQGSILAGTILGQAAVSHDNKYAVQTQAYSSELRGGFAATWLIVSDEPILYPRVVKPDVLVAQAQDAVNRFGGTVKEGGVLIYDQDLVTELPKGVKNLYKVAATTLARQEVGAAITANMVVLGALCKVSGVVSRQALETAIKANVPKGKDGINLKAFDLGFTRVERVG